MISQSIFINTRNDNILAKISNFKHSLHDKNEKSKLRLTMPSYIGNNKIKKIKYTQKREKTSIRMDLSEYDKVFKMKY